MSEAQRLREAEEAVRDAAPMLTYCSFCPDWRFAGNAAEGREEAVRHRLEIHGIEPKPKRHTRHLARFRQPVLDDEERALIEFERQRRARVNGVKLERREVGPKRLQVEAVDSLSIP